jgi:DNA-binding response OmpR family regulator
MPVSRILLADDDVELGEMLTQYLAAEGFAVDTAHDGETALAKARGGDFDLVILDVMMPRMNGFDVLRELRAKSLIPVLMLTARGEDVDSIVGLELGADDYLAKPCNPRVLVARVRAILRRAESAGAPDGPAILKLGDLEINAGTRRVRLRGQPVAMTSTEYSVLEVLLHEAGHVVSKANLSERALGRKLTRYDRSLDMHVASLRKKLGPLDGGEERIKTVRGVGYQYTRP